jgi:outer membrane protein insertion porin family
LTAKVGQPEVEIKDDGIDVIYKVWEGDRYKMGDTSFTGDLIDEPSKLLQVTKIDDLKQEGEYFDRLVLKQDVSALTSYYNDYGYAYADVGVKLDDNPETKIVNVVYTISKHQRVHIRRVLIEGNTVTRDNVILREMRLADGDQFSGEKLKRSSQRLTNLDFFEKVDIAPVPTGNPEEMDLVVKVKDKATGKISGGVGYSTYDGIFFGGEISEKNLFGRGYDVGFNGQIGGSSTKYVLHFTNPHINDTDLGFGAKLYRRSTDYAQYTIAGTGGSVDFSYPIGEYTKLKWDYNLEAYDITDVSDSASQDIKDDRGSHLASIVAASVTRDTRDNFRSTTTGTKTKLSALFGGGPIGGTDDFIKFTGEFEWWHPVLEQVVFHSKFWAGYLHKNLGGNDVPTAQRFDLGGVYTVRGYSNYLITPTEGPASDAAVGGDKAFYTNLELKRPISKELGIVALGFFDAGNSWKEGEQWFESVERGDVGKPSLGLYKSVGVGINWYSPIGPVGLIYAYALDDLADSKQHTFELMMGQQF